MAAAQLQFITCQFARVVKGVDLRSTTGNCAWVRTAQLTNGALVCEPCHPHGLCTMGPGGAAMRLSLAPWASRGWWGVTIESPWASAMEPPQFDLA